MRTTRGVKDARKIRYSNEQIKAIIILLEQFIEETDFPKLASFIILPEVRHKFKLTSQYINDHPEYFGYLSEVMTAKCEDFLTRKALSGHASIPAMFMLKQPKFGGYSDKQEVDFKSNQQPIKFVNMVPRPKSPPRDKKSRPK